MNPPELPMNISCPIRVRLTGMVLNNNNGSFSLLGPGETATACVDVLQNQFTVTDDMFERWASFTNHTWDNPPGTPPYNSQTYAASKEILMDTLDITLEGGFQTTIPHYELINPDRGDGLDGSYIVLNNGRIQSAVGNGQTDYGVDFGVLLGGVFGAGIYILIDYDRNQVSLAKANLNPGTQDIRTICSTNISVPTPTPSRNPPNNQNGPTKAEIIGIIIGIVALIIAVIGVVYTALQYHRHPDNFPSLDSLLHLVHLVHLLKRNPDVLPQQTDNAGTPGTGHEENQTDIELQDATGRKE
jgi:hypothetical protein